MHRCWTTVLGVVLLGLLGSAATGSYVVRRGDTLSGIAAEHGVSTSALAQANGITNPNRVVEGRTLSIPGAVATTTHQIAQGDTLIGIARRYGVSAAALAATNGISNPNRIVVGRVLTISGTTATAPAAPAAAMAATHVVKAGEYLSDIAARYGLTTGALAQANGITNPNRVREGARLTVPLAAVPALAVSGNPNLPARLRASPARLALLPTFDRWAAHYGVPSDLLKAMTWLESGWQSDVVSHTGAVGIGQLMPATVDWMEDVLIGADLDPYDPDDNIRMSARYLRWLLHQTGGSAATSLAGYYQGLQSVRTIGLYDDTQSYVAGVLAFRSHFA
jgi:LysM repeat protein